MLEYFSCSNEEHGDIFVCFTPDEEIGLGLSDKSFFKQVIPYLQDIKESHNKFYTTLIMLSNHTPFDDLELTDEFDTSLKYEVNNQTIIANPIRTQCLKIIFVQFIMLMMQ